MNTPDTNTVRSAIHNDGGIKKSLLTPFRRIGLSRKRKNANTGFNSPLAQENIDLNYDSPASKLVVTEKAKHTESSITPLSRNKKPKTELSKSEDKTPDTRPKNIEDGHSKREKSKERNKNVDTKSHRKTKKKLVLDSDSEDDNGGNNPLNMSGYELFTKEDIESKNSGNKAAITEIKPVIDGAKKNTGQVENEKIVDNKTEDVSVSSKRSKVSDNHKRKPQEKVKPKGRKKLIIDSDSDDESIQIIAKKLHELHDQDKKSTNIRNNQEKQNNGSDTMKSTEKYAKDNLKTYSRQNSTKSTEEKSNTKPAILDKIVNRTDYQVATTMSPKTLQNLETKPLLYLPEPQTNPETDNQNMQSNHTKMSEVKIMVNKTSLDEYIKKKESQKSRDNSKLKSKLSTKKTPKSEELDSDEEFLRKKSTDSSKHLENPKDKSMLIDQILQVEKNIKDKEMQLEKFKQAEVYHKLHNVDDLTTLTELWKGGCKNALEDLLAKLREHANIDMNGLLQNLRAPKTLMQFDTENDCFL